jgi:hypothetical protein
MKQSIARGLVVSLGFGLAGCDRESLEVYRWEQAGLDAAPVSNIRGEARIVQISEGTGPEIRAGDLVRIRVTVIVSGYLAHQSAPAIAWVWTGREPESRDDRMRSAWGDMGSPRFRKSLIGRRVGEHFMYELGDSDGGQDSIPLHGFEASNSYALTDTNGRPTGMRKWPRVVVGERLAARATGARVEVLAACEARLFRRIAVMRQRGTIINMFEMYYGSEREGTLRWSALEANCGPPLGKVRLEVGPLFYYRGREDYSLFNWSDSYRRLRPDDRVLN